MKIHRNLAGAAVSVALTLAQPANADLLGGSANGALSGTLSGRMGDIGGMADGRAAGSIGAQTDAIDRVGQRTRDVGGRVKNRTETTGDTVRNRSVGGRRSAGRHLRCIGAGSATGTAAGGGAASARHRVPTGLISMPRAVRAVGLRRQVPGSWRSHGRCDGNLCRGSGRHASQFRHADLTSAPTRSPLQP